MITSVAQIESRMFLIRGEKVMLSQHLAELYEVEPRTLNQAVKRNIERFPEDFMFQLTEEEAALLRSQIVTLKTGRGQHAKYLPYAFTEQGVAMLPCAHHKRHHPLSLAGRGLGITSDLAACCLSRMASGFTRG